MSDTVFDILLVGGGHSHVAVLADWARRGNPAKRAALLTPQPFLRYSGMVPGWLAGEHTNEAGLVDLAGLAKAAGVDLVLDRCVAMDPGSRHVLSLDSGLIPFRVASIDVGGVGRAASVLGNDPRLRDVRPIDGFVDTLKRDLPTAGSIAVVGGGAGGVELAFALRNRTRKVSQDTDACHVTLIAGEQGLLPDFSDIVQGKVRAELEAQTIDVIEVDAWIERGVLMAGEVAVPADLIVAAIGSGAPAWPGAGGLDVD